MPSFLKGFFGPFALADLNGDGKLDLLLSEVASFDFTEPFAGAVVGLGNGDGTFSPIGNYEAGADSSRCAPGEFPERQSSQPRLCQRQQRDHAVVFPVNA